MSVLHQIGHNSENLLLHDGLEAFEGAILSPVNYDQTQVAAQMAKVRTSRNFRFLFDPQLYFPNSRREKLREWSYFPGDVDTADLSSDAWWDALCAKLSNTAVELGVDAVCSPAVVPRLFDDGYYSTAVSAAAALRSRLSSSIETIQTAIVSLNDLGVRERVLSVASILSRTESAEVFLVLVSEKDPRRELRDADELKGAMKLISLLAEAGLRVTVGYCATDLLLWKFAGAHNCASGKFFNLRRFTEGRFDEPAGGGGQLPYWTEESLLAFLRESDVVRVEAAGLLSDASNRNPFSAGILSKIHGADQQAWVADSWKHYMWWFADAEHRIAGSSMNVPNILKAAELNWTVLEDANVFMEEKANDGTWLRSWRRACAEFRQ
jgi:hypothetical protein